MPYRSTGDEIADAVEQERKRCAEIARSLAYGDNEAVRAVCGQIADAIEMGDIVEDVRTPY
jgi:threonine aldolase